MSQWIHRSKEAVLHYSNGRARSSIDMKDDPMTDKAFSLSYSSPPIRSPSILTSGVSSLMAFSSRSFHGNTPSTRSSSRRPSTAHTVNVSPSASTCSTNLSHLIPHSRPQTASSPSCISLQSLPDHPITSPLSGLRPTTPRTAKNLWKRFRHVELAGMMGVADQNQHPHTSPTHGRKSSHSDLAGDDPLESGQTRTRSRNALRELNGYPTNLVTNNGAMTHNSSQFNSPAGTDDVTSQKSNRSILYPTIKIRPEYNTVYRKDRTGEQSRQNVVCVVSVEVPSRRIGSKGDDEEQVWLQRINQRGPEMQDSHAPDDEVVDSDEDDEVNHKVEQIVGQPDRETDEADRNTQSSEDEEEPFSFGATPSAVENDKLDPFANVVEDLRRRVIQWNGYSVDRFGPLVLYDFLGVRQVTVVREFYVYLFKDALLCVSEEKKKEKGLARLIGSDKTAVTSPHHFDDAQGNHSVRNNTNSNNNKPALKLRGRIWLRHINKCMDMPSEGDVHCLGITLNDESLDHFVLCFKDRGHRELWREKISELLDRLKESNNNSSSKSVGKQKQELPPLPIVEVPEETKSPSINRRHTAASIGGHSVQSGKSGSNNLTTSPSTSFSSPNAKTSQAATMAPSGIVTTPPRAESSTDHSGKVSRALSIPGVPTYQQWSASGGLDPSLPAPDMLPHTPIDLVIMVSVPNVTTQPGLSSTTLSSSAALKLRLIRSTLDFVVSHLGVHDRIALVAYNVGLDGLVRRTSLLNASKEKSRERLEYFIETIGKPWEESGPDPFQEDIDRLGGNSDQTDTVTAVNVGFDIVLQRKSKNPITGMLLINDTSDAPRRGQMDLVMARAEAAKVPVHCFGFGKSHDPSSLWLISNHTRGSYTFVKEWYQLRECVAGCIGSMMSVALTEVKLHISVPSDNCFKVRKVAGPSGAIVSSSGKNVDIELGELRFGDCKELFVELELDINALLLSMQRNSGNRLTASGAAKNLSDHYEKGSATDDFMQRLGLQSLSLSDVEQNSFDHASLESHFIDEVPVLEVDCGCRDPSLAYTTTRLPTPGVLTLEINGNSPDPVSELAGGSAGLATALADPVVTRRRLEILVSDMITRCLLLVSRRNHGQALTILLETRRIVDTVLQAIPVDPHRDNPTTPNRYTTSNTRSSQNKKQREMLHRKTAISLLAILEDLDVLIDGLESNQHVSFERTERNFGAQQAMILRDQKAWTSRTDTEWQFHRNIDNAAPFAAQAAAYALVGRSN